MKNKVIQLEVVKLADGYIQVYRNRAWRVMAP